jgi:hypothetical protein
MSSSAASFASYAGKQQVDRALHEINESTEYQDYDRPGKKHWELPKISQSTSSIDLLSDAKRQ